MSVAGQALATPAQMNDISIDDGTRIDQRAKQRPTEKLEDITNHKSYEKEKPVPPPESRSRRREEAHPIPDEGNQSLLTSAATAWGSTRASFWRILTLLLFLLCSRPGANTTQAATAWGCR